MELIPALPQELGLECLTRLHYSNLRIACSVSWQWQKVLQSSNFHYQRKQSGYTQKLACLIQAIQVPDSPQTQRTGNSPSYGITLFDSVSGTWERLSPIPEYPNGLPLFAQLVSSEGKIIVMGGWDPVSYNLVKNVFVYDFTTRQWRQGEEMPSRRSFFAAGSIGGRVYVAGGHDENKNALKSAWAYDVRNDEWTELTQMTRERDECEGVVIGDEFWVVSGFGTEKQGVFEGSAESYRVDRGEWKQVEGVWTAGQCPRSCVAGVDKDGKVVSWADESDSLVCGGACWVPMGGWTLVTGLAHDGGNQEFFLTYKVNEDQSGKIERLNVPDEFCGFVQSGCFLEI